MIMVLTVRAVLGGHGRRRRGRRGVSELLADPSLQLGAVVVVPAAVLRILKLIHCLIIIITVTHTVIRIVKTFH